jgi:16S rRNA (guanine(966)-N(2))-methyltransferase RsmD
MDSKLQIISGVFRGRKLRLPPNARPTQNRARVALFNMLESGLIDVSDRLIVWDSFGGSGAFGIECLSRYPNANVIFTDVNPTSIRTIRDNLAGLSVGTCAHVVQDDAIVMANKFGDSADLIFIDAPYDMHELGIKLVKKLTAVAKVGAIVVWEVENNKSVNVDAEKWRVLRDKIYGRARFLILQKL